MKKATKKLCSAAVVLAFGVASFAQSISVTNIFGGNADNTPASDLLSFDKDFNRAEMNVGDRVQLDVSSEKLESRVRLDFSIPKTDGKNASVRLRGYVGYKPFDFVTIAVGNNFFSKYGISAARLCAADDYTQYGKLIDNDGAGVIFNVAGVKVAGALASESRMNLNFGGSYEIENVAGFGITAQDVTEDSRSLSAFASLLAVENLSLNAGYTYNYANTSYLGSTQQAVQVSGGYNFADLGLGLYGDVQLGLNKVKGDGSKAEYVLDEGSNGLALPLYVGLRASYKASDVVSATLSTSVKSIPEGKGSLAVNVYPYVDLDTGVGTFRSGVRANFNEDGFAGLSIPVSWQYKMKF